VSFPHLASRPSHVDAQHETPEERAYDLKLSDLDPKKLTNQQKTAIVHAVACCLPRSALGTGVRRVRNQKPKLNAEAGDGALTHNCSTVKGCWELQYLSLLIKFFELDALLIHALQPLLGKCVDPSPFMPQLGVTTFAERMRILLLLLHFSIIAIGGYDARIRAMLRMMTNERLLGISWVFFTRQENRYALLVAQDLAAHEKSSKSTSSKVKKWAAVSAAGVGAGALLFFTGGLAAPALGAGLASLGIAGAASSAVFLASTAGAILVATVFGGVGAGLVGWKLNRRISGLQEFRFEKLSKGEACMSVALTVNGWLTHLSDYHNVWAPLVPGRVICSTLAADDQQDATSRSKDVHLQVGASGLTAGQMMRKEEVEVEALRKSVNANAAAASSSAPYVPSTPQPIATVSIDDSAQERAEFEAELRARRQKLIDERIVADDGEQSNLSLSAPNPSLASQAFQRAGLAEYSSIYTLRWESPWLLRFGNGLKDLSAKELAGPAATVGLKQTALAGVVAAVAWPVALLQAGDLIDNPWLVILNRCEQASIELANALEARVAGSRPITLIAYSMGARVVFLALEELYRRSKARRKARQAEEDAADLAALQVGEDGKPLKPEQKKGLMDRMRAYKKKRSASKNKLLLVNDHDKLDAHGVVLDVFLFGCPIPCDLLRWLRVRSMISGRLVTGYCKKDWLLRFVYPLTNLSRKVAGLMPVQRGKEARRKEAAAVEARRRNAPKFQGDSNDQYPGAAAMRYEPSSSSAPSSPRRANESTRGSSTARSSVAGTPEPLDAKSSSSGDVDHTAEMDSDEEAEMDGIVEGEAEVDEEQPSLSASASPAAPSSAASLDDVSPPAPAADPPTIPPRPTHTLRPSQSMAAPTSDAASSTSAPQRTFTADFSKNTASRAGSLTRQPSYVAPASAAMPPTVVCCGIESYDLTPYVAGHRDYPFQIELLLQKCSYQP
jgi:hypothetical protein